MKIKIDMTKTETREIEVTFPLYLESTYSDERGGSETYVRVDGDGHIVELERGFYGDAYNGEWQIREMKRRENLVAYLRHRLSPDNGNWSGITAKQFFERADEFYWVTGNVRMLILEEPSYKERTNADGTG